MIKKILISSCALIALLLIQQSTAHHSIAGQYSFNKPLNITGTVERIDWTNPHAYLYVKDDKKGTVYRIEINGLHSLSGRGWTGTELPVGTQIEIVDAYLKIDAGSTTACCANIYDMEGYEYFTGFSVANDKETGVRRKPQSQVENQ